MNNLMQEITQIKDEAQFNAFIEKHGNNPVVKKAQAMCSGRNGVTVAQQLAQSMGVDFGALQKQLGIGG